MRLDRQTHREHGVRPGVPFFLCRCTVLLLFSARLASYYSSPAGTLLLLIGWHPTGHRRWLASPLPGGSARHLPFRSVGPTSVTPSRGIALPP